MIAASAYMVVFRIVHIVSGVIWVGSVFLFVVYLQPASAAIAPAGAPLMSELLGKRRLVDGQSSRPHRSRCSAGSYLLARLARLSELRRLGDVDVRRRHVGALCAIAAMGFGVFVTRPNVGRLLALGRQVAESGAPPTPEVGAEMGAIQQRLKRAARVSLGLLIVAVVAMSSARYL